MVNSIQVNNLKIGNFLVIILILQFIMYSTVFLDIPIARQVVGFFYLTFIPGIILLRILKLDELDIAEKILFSVGLSIAFLMLTGLLINELCPLVGVSKPLSLMPLTIIITSIVLFLCFLSCLTNKEPLNITIKSSKSFLSIVTFILLPSLSVAGAILVNAFQNNFLLLLMIVAISVLIVLSIVSEKLVSPKFYPLLLIIIAIALLFHASLISKYLYGHDIQSEYFVFRLTEDNSRWDPVINASRIFDRLNSMLSVTVLPAIYSSILNMEGAWILKVIYPLIFSFVPLGLYQLYQMQFGKKVAFVSTFFFMANSVFFTEMLGLARQMIAELFYVLLFFVLLNKKMNPLSKWACFIIFSFALVVSHYSLSYVFLFFIFLAWLSLFLLKNKTSGITASSVALFFIILFSWYIYVSRSGPFNVFVMVGNIVFRNFFSEFFNPGSRGEITLRGLGMESASSFGNLIGRIFAYATEFFIVVGFIALITKRKKMNFDKEYIVISSLNMALLVMCIAAPYFASSLNMTRFYHIQLFFLAPFCILGSEIFFRFIKANLKTESCIALILIVLIPFFLFQAQLVYEVTGDDSWSIPLSKYRMDAIHYMLLGIIDEQDAFGAQWLSKNIDVWSTPIYADVKSKFYVMASYGKIDRDRVDTLSNNTEVVAGGIVYLGRINKNGIMWGSTGWWNTTEISPLLSNMSKIYSNGGCEIYRH